MKVVLDTSVVVNLFSSFYPDRSEVAKRIAKLSEMGILEIYAPRLGEFEFVSVLSRFLSQEMVREAHEIYMELVADFVGEGLLSDRILELAFSTGHRIPDLYFVATAQHINALLLTNDRKMAEMARSAGVKAFYLTEEADEFFKLAGVNG
ncbi:predicted nucleic acid-binding protein, containing PIN domain [Thermococcus kodakarensis KOD1]|uniref:Predicted nucleic acid-binding protein, containing PIN domain n=1 Tax=Thermococcus kodakarensis (strain ATCC BAA-918 / JCM 12380 / KOD1) TaxID=69014 RepID=Q5JFM3_THEKO|nr:type II toxin-antitoxin system VapC family toxin [Thermococcus kodakarensis]WCN28287.1 type II toxin-antitoxin system VapC family toxin [Thermococcus kodakarensis]WCN30582.1 type II toxin-antitoxin system VapC family toxin [Thermococcus kodakarensis]BAD84380.1 predicted nucleic acid-binding protein, containing PIN domain [Thermococcus kodakarensis KOD1]